MPDGPEEYVDRPRGILTKKERRYLLGMLDEDPKEQSDAIRQRNYRIRQHVRHAIIDFHLLALTNPPGLEKVFEDARAPPKERDSDLRTGIESLFELLYVHLGNRDGDASEFTTHLYDGIESALIRLNAQDGVSVDPDVGLLITLGAKVPLDDVSKAFKEEEEFLLPVELDALYWGDTVPVSKVIQRRKESQKVIRDLIKQGKADETLEPAERRKERREELAEEIEPWIGEILNNDIMDT